MANKTLKVVAGDFHFDTDGKTRFVQEDEKAAQDLAWAILRQPDIEFVRSKAKAEQVITTGVEDLRRIQQASRQLVDREEIANIVELLVVPDPSKPETQAFFFLTVVTEAGDRVNKLFDQDTFSDLSHLLPARLNNDA